MFWFSSSSCIISQYIRLVIALVIALVILANMLVQANIILELLLTLRTVHFLVVHMTHFYMSSYIVSLAGCLVTDLANPHSNMTVIATPGIHVYRS